MDWVETGHEDLSKKVPFRLVCTHHQTTSLSSIRVGNQGSILRKSQFHSFTQYGFTKCLQIISFHLQPFLGKKKPGISRGASKFPPSLQLKGHFLELVSSVPLKGQHPKAESSLPWESNMIFSNTCIPDIQH